MKVLVDEEFKRELKPPASFGDIALLYNSKRTATIRSITHCELYGITR